MIRWFRDWRRGYSDADLASVRAKLARELSPWAVIRVTSRELRALLDDRNNRGLAEKSSTGSSE